MKALQIARHDAAVEMLRHCISAAGGEEFSGAAMLMDAGKRSELPTEVLGKGSDLRTWLTKCAPTPPTEEQLAMLSKPDIVILPGVKATEFAAGLANPSGSDRLPAGQPIVLVEVGFCSDTRAAAKEEEKLAQHKQLVQVLRTLGFKVQCYPVPLGHGGSVYTGLDTMLEHMGVQASARNRLVSKLAGSTVRYAHACLVTRRRLEAEIKNGVALSGAQHAELEPG
jgi:hypothetical protein